MQINKINNINFGARLTEGTFNFLLDAREKGLRTKELENLMYKVYPDEFIKTYATKDRILGMEVVEKPEIMVLKGSKTILKNQDLVYHYTNSPKPDEELVDYVNNGYIGSYEINQKTIDAMVENLKNISKREKENMTPRVLARRQLIEKFGYPVSDGLQEAKQTPPEDVGYYV